MTSVYFNRIGNFMTKLADDTRTVGEDRKKIVRDIKYWTRSSF